MWNNIFIIFKSLNKKTKIEVILLVIFMLVNSLAELLNIAIFIPYISLLQNKDNRINFFFESFIGERSVTSITLIVILITLIAGLIRLLSIRWSSKVANKISAEIVYKAYNSILNKQYTFYLTESKNKLISIIHTNGSYLFREVLNPLFILINCFLFLITIFSALILYDLKSLVVATLCVTSVYYYISKRARKNLQKQGVKQVELRKLSLERLDIALSSIEYILLGNFQDVFSKNYGNLDKEIKNSEAVVYRTAAMPRFLIEYFCLILLVIITYRMFLSGNFDENIPLLAGAALAVQKVFPYAQRGFENWATLTSSNEGLSSLLNYVLLFENLKISKKKSHNISKETVSFTSLEFKNVSYSYKRNEEVLNNINLKLESGEKLAVIGKSGCGKSTFLRLCCGLLTPTKGVIELNGESFNVYRGKKNSINWVRSIGYVPQKINLTGKTLRENIIFGTNEKRYGKMKIEEIIEITCLDNLVKRCNGLDNQIFENYFNLSGGESQRLAIARALYRNPKLLFMDEPTSSLDIATQDVILNNLINIKDLTCILITHRLENMKHFDRVLKIQDNKLIEQVF